MDPRGAALVDRLNESSLKYKAAAAKRDEKQRKRYPDKILHKEWSGAMQERFGGELEVPPWSQRDKGVARALVKAVGLDRAIAMVKHLMETWDARRYFRQKAHDDLPSIHIVFAMRQKLLAELDGLSKVPMSKEERLAQREFSEEGEALSPSQGWGDVLE